ncbi:hypothetical protein BD626DRAFT_495393 [Schizophyllum amplum]|uniref:Uncharacterized protein n=1 Tax=Schizophyllum amplum TaxID=97359 RepID=A0A550CE44_9AGAR|nr:hypothetical protein BD626DRAFT_495393 [Auriculariopsis ampla]
MVLPRYFPQLSPGTGHSRATLACAEHARRSRRAVDGHPHVAQNSARQQRAEVAH